MNLLDSTAAQLRAVDTFFESQHSFGKRLQYRPARVADVALAA
jgi:tRNA-dihydrouridine synthase B